MSRAHRGPALLVTLIVLLAVERLVRAQTAPPAPPEPPPPAPPVRETVVTGTRTPEDVQRATVRTTLVTREEAERRGATNAAEALAGELGVQVNPGAYSTLGSPSGIQIQGFDRERVLVLEDGERLIGDVGGVIDLSSFPLTDLDRIEVVFGPTSALYGTAALGGVVNLLTAAPPELDWSLRTRAEWRSVTGALGQATAAYRASRFWVAADGSGQRADGVQLDPARPDLAFPLTLRTVASLRAGLTFRERDELRVRVRWIHEALDSVESAQLPGLGTYVTRLPTRQDRLRAHVTHTLGVGDAATLRLSYSGQWFVSAGDKQAEGSPVGETRHRRGSLTALEATVTLPDGPRTWVLGTRYEAEVFEQGLTRREVQAGQLGTSDFNEVPPTSLSSLAVYGQLSWKLLPRLTALAGVRGEWHLRYGAVAAPRAALSARPIEALQLRAGVGRGYRAPGAKEFGFSFDHSFYGYRVNGNADLVPETSWGINADFTARLHRRLVWRGAGFFNWVTDLIDTVLEPTLGSGGISIFSYRNVARARTGGGQSDLLVTVHDRVRLQGGYAHLHTRDEATGLPLVGRPDHTVLGVVDLDLPWKLAIYARWRWVSPAFIDPATTSPGFHTVDARVSRRLVDKMQLYAGVTNALNVLRNPMQLGDQRPVQGRVVYVGLRADVPWWN